MIKSSILSGTDLSKKYGDLEVVKGVSLAVNEGEFVCLVGKSGCGKTTLLSLLSGLEKPTKGRVNLDGREITTSSEDELALFRRDNVKYSHIQHFIPGVTQHLLCLFIDILILQIRIYYAYRIICILEQIPVFFL